MYKACFIFAFSIPSLVFSVDNSADEYYLRGLLIGLSVALMMAKYIADDVRTLPSSKSGRQASSLFLAVLVAAAGVAVTGYVRAVYLSDFLNGMFSIVLMIGIYLIARRHPFDPANTLCAANIAGVLHIIIAHLQYYRLSKGIPWIIPLEKTFAAGVVGNIGYRGVLSIFIALCVVNGIYLVSRAKSRKSGAFFLTMTVALLAGMLSIGGRAAVIALLGAIAPWIPYCVARVKGRLSRRNVASIALTVLLLIGSLAYAGRNTTIARSLMQIGRDGSSSLRLSHYATTLVMIRDNAFAGVGLGNYKFHYLEAQKRMKAEFEMAKKLPWTYSLWAHNEYLHFAAEFGLVLFAVLLVVAVVWCVRICKYLRKTRGNAPPEFLWGLSIVIVLLVSSLFERPFHHIDVMIWFPFGCAAINNLLCPASVQQTAEKPCRKRTTFNRSAIPQAIGLLIAGVLLLAGSALYIHGTYGQYALRKAYTALPKPNTPQTSYDEAFGYMRKASVPLLTRDEASRFKAYIDVPYYSSLEQRHSSLENIEALWNAIERLYAYFLRHPTLETFLYLQKVTFTYQRADIYRRIVGYMPQSPKW